MSTSSVVNICNMAVVSLGGSPITSLTDGTVESLLCNTIWNNARRATLRAHYWNFATKRTQLAVEVTTPTYGYKYSFPLPSDCLRVIEVLDDRDYKVERKRILTNSPICYIKYIFDNEDIGQWDDSFIDLLVARLRVDLAFGITRSNSTVETAEKIYQMKLRIAKGVDASEDIPDPFGLEESALIGVRR